MWIIGVIIPAKILPLCGIKPTMPSRKTSDTLSSYFQIIIIEWVSAQFHYWYDGFPGVFVYIPAVIISENCQVPWTCINTVSDQSRISQTFLPYNEIVSSLSWSSGWRLSLYLAEKWCTYSYCCYRTNPSRRRLVLLCVCTARTFWTEYQVWGRRVVIGTIILLAVFFCTHVYVQQTYVCNTYTFSLIHTHTHTHAHSHSHAHAYTHAHLHTYSHSSHTHAC